MSALALLSARCRGWGRCLLAVALVLLASLSGGYGARAQATAAAPREKVLRVCQDPNNLPFSNRALNGFENKIAALFARELGWEIAYTWYPQRMGFVRNTLRAKDAETQRYKCDLITGVTVGFDMGVTTQAYYHSTYAMVYAKGKGLDGVQSLDDLLTLPAATRQRLRLGVFGGSPVTGWLLQHGLIEQMVSYQPQSGDPAQYPGQMVENDVANGVIDIAFVWGPIGGYFAQQSRQVAMAVVPLQPRSDLRLDFGIAMAVRFGDKDLRQRIDGLIARNRGEIAAILRDYGVPLIDDAATPPVARR